MSRSSKILIAAAVGIVGGLVLGGLYATRNPDKPLWLSLGVVGLALGPTVAWTAWRWWLNRAAVEAERARHVHDVETTWWQRASSTAFHITLPTVILADIVGDVLHVPWISPVSSLHVLVIGLGAFGGSYLTIRTRES